MDLSLGPTMRMVGFMTIFSPLPVIAFRTGSPQAVDRYLCLLPVDRYLCLLRGSRSFRRASGPEAGGWRCRDAGSDSRERGHGLRAHPACAGRSRAPDTQDGLACV